LAEGTEGGYPPNPSDDIKKKFSGDFRGNLHLAEHWRGSGAHITDLHKKTPFSQLIHTPKFPAKLLLNWTKTPQIQRNCPPIHQNKTIYFIAHF